MVPRCLTPDIRRIDGKWGNNRTGGDHAAMKRLPGYRQGFRGLRTAKAILSGIETIRTIKPGRVHHKQPGVRGEIGLINTPFETAA
ncbi:DDE-type integrase/transposase/recombinase [Sedimentitalea sp. HM32M-2]|uniref:DDE-type integrase/transposase/recombinase n=1 Tax=Sedimentitalea sp. HM32M-2 TaxID=3351566 RepID=UPI00362EC5F2